MTFLPMITSVDVTLALPFMRWGEIRLQDILIMLFVMCLSLSIHEAAHAWAAYRMGDDTAALQGRLTLNPLRHLDPIGALMFMIAGIGWARPVPINPSRFTEAKSIKRGIFITSLWGPLSNLLLGTVSWILYCVTFTIWQATGYSDSFIFEMLFPLLLTLYAANMWLCVFNLLPVPPLDGYKIFGAALPPRLYYRIMSKEQYIGIAFIIIVIFFRPALVKVLNAILVPFNFVIQQPITWLFRQLQEALGFLPMPSFSLF